MMQFRSVLSIARFYFDIEILGKENMVKCMKIFSYLKPYRMMVALALFLMLAELAVELLQPLLMAKIIDDGIMQANLAVVIKWGSVMVGISILSFIGGIINSFAASHVSQSFGYDIRSHFLCFLLLCQVNQLLCQTHR